jgi:hypothetical protein
VKRQIQPANSPLAWFCDIPQWRCSRGCWENVTNRTCYGHGETGPCCTECGGDGSFEEAGSGRVSQCDACAGHGMQWDWPDEGRREKTAAPTLAVIGEDRA